VRNPTITISRISVLALVLLLQAGVLAAAGAVLLRADEDVVGSQALSGRRQLGFEV
jgi:hypothetical protein